MAGIDGGGLSRVTLVAPRVRIDLALPSDVPLADLLPTLLRYAGDEVVEDPAARDGWSVARLGGLALDTSRTPAQLEIRDGELLYLRPRQDEGPALVFDDVVDAVATATSERAGHWGRDTSRLFGLALGVVSLLGGAAVVLFAGPPQGPSGLVGLGTAVVLLTVAIVLARAAGDSRAGVALALVAMVYAAIGGLLVFAGDRTLDRLAAPHVLVATTMLLLAAVLGAVGVGDAAPVFLAAGASAAALLAGVALHLVSGAGIAGAAAIIATLAFAMLPVLPMLAYRIAHLPVPSVPADPEALKQDAEAVDSARVLELSARADGYLAGMLGTVAVIGAAAAGLVTTAGVPGTVMAGILGLLLMSRARWFAGATQRLLLLVTGAVALGATVVAVFAVAGPALRLTAVLGAAVAVAGLAVGFGLAGGRRTSPMPGRILDLGEVLLILNLVPLTVWISGVYEWIRTIRG